jgi:hypothetical protein
MTNARTIALCGYSDMGTPKSDQIARGDSIMLCNVFGTIFTCTKITGGIGPWPKFNHDWDNVNDPQSDTDVLAMSGTRSYIEARGRTRTFRCLFEVPSRIAEDFLQVEREAFRVPAGLGQRDARPRSITFLAVHCEIAELMSAGPESPQTPHVLFRFLSLRAWISSGL